MFGSRHAALDWAATLGCIIALWIVVAAFSQQLAYAYSRQDQLTEMFDAYSEAGGIRAGDSYAEEGFGKYLGLPNIAYGSSFANVGGKHDKLLCSTSSEECIYLHYPPGPDLIIGVATKLFGKGKVSSYRLFPLTFGLACLLSLAFAMARTIGWVRAAFVLAVLRATPMAFNAFHYLHYISYQTSLLYANVGTLLLLFAAKSRSEGAYRPTKLLVAHAVVNFLAGCVSFEYAPQTLLLPVAVWFLFQRRDAASSRRPWSVAWRTLPRTCCTSPRSPRSSTASGTLSTTGPRARPNARTVRSGTS
jgi:hypothetical protein